ncbi:uncharacterized protein LOC111408307 [Olea europaea var. sylvestris]|uniref:uncharacterized protein LOC111408307 n=1 Tax=Olea europaea var. sylvestris TaxID=158386 RepID=UPI000C1D2DA7|nr:uncharacterized protein LOC111408307 [Olea europaea var. sylvestris]
MQKIPYSSAIGSLMYAKVRLRHIYIETPNTRMGTMVYKKTPKPEPNTRDSNWNQADWQLRCAALGCTIRDKNQLSPIERAALMGKKKMVQYLYDITPLNKDFKAKERMDILIALIDSDMYDIALKILEADRYIVRRTPKSTKGSALHALARKPLSHYATSREWSCERLVRIVNLYVSTPFNSSMYFLVFLFCFKRIYGSIQKRRQSIQLVEKLWEQILTLEGSKISNLFNETPILTDAAKIGNVEFMALLISSFPELVWRIDSAKHSIFHEVEKILRPLDVQNKNKQGKTPRELFTEEHKKLLEAGEKWIKDTATSCMVVATLIATVALNASFTVPDGNK